MLIIHHRAILENMCPRKEVFVLKTVNANDMLWEANTLDKRSRPEAGSRRGSRSQDDVHAVWVLWLQTNGVSTDGAAAKVMNLTD